MDRDTLRVYGASAAIHDAVAGVRGDFDRCVDALEHTPDLTIETGVARPNARHLSDLARWLCARGVRAWTLIWPGPVPDGSGPPRLALVVPRMLHAATQARREGLPARLCGVPTCLLGPHRELARTNRGSPAGKVCSSCPGPAACPGVPESYARWYAGDLELRGVRERP